MTDRPHATAEQYERWYKRDCARCGRHRDFAAHWPDGHVCRTCHDRALRLRGHCPSCGQDRILPALAESRPVCTRCAGFRQSYTCSRCGSEGKLHGGRRCTRCTLDNRLAELLGDGTGEVRPELRPLHAALVAMDNPLSGLTWLYQPYVPVFLRGLGTGEITLTHKAFDELEPWRAAEHLRELLMGCALLPPVDKQILLFERWLHGYLPDLPDPSRARILRQFTTWQVLPWLRRRAEGRPLGTHTRNSAAAQVRRAAEFLAWLAREGRTLAECGQADLDRWHVAHRDHEHHSLRPFLRWAMHTEQMPALTIPRHEIRQQAPISQHRRIGLLRRLLTDDTPALRTRVAAVLVLLYAQPLSRIVRLTTADILLDGDQVLIRLRDPPSPVPEPFAALLLALRDSRTNMRTATNPNSPWLFPGRRSGQPLRPEGLATLLRELGIPTRLGRTAALRQLVLQAPAPVVASTLGFHHSHTARLVGDAGGTWSHYAPGDHGTRGGKSDSPVPTARHRPVHTETET
ncbi:hypothetical protein [Pseudofrankia sp. BMG5.36]|uniref:hypothetical protein n=1 Tax=Pseudofrankia sp. BMG5.36 TaxID=1834512 RepID=UPI0008DA14A7|nr:hypothetical protein [Pseudofrankia sp. BMG5.36]OHV73637.1 hypothetical protein BCD48_33175 [Pseudofrankia sp. BMG5.36]